MTTTETFNYTPIRKVVWAGEDIDGKVFVKIRYDNRLNPTHPPSLGITGVVGPKRNGGCKGSCGQILGFDGAPCTWRASGDLKQGQLDQLAFIWHRWHLNTMRAGSPRQEAWLREHPVTAVYPESHHAKAKAALAEAGLQPDIDYLVDGEPYSYGSRWLHEEVPYEVLAFLRELPECSIAYPWQDSFDRKNP